MSVEVGLDTFYKPQSVLGLEMSGKCSEIVEYDVRTVDWAAYAVVRKVVSEPLGIKREYVFAVDYAARCEDGEEYSLRIYLPNFPHLRIDAEVVVTKEGLKVESVIVSEVF